MNDLKLELETLEKELKELDDNIPIMSDFASIDEFFSDDYVRKLSIIRIQKSIINIQSLIIRQLESKQ